MKGELFALTHIIVCTTATYSSCSFGVCWGFFAFRLLYITVIKPHVLLLVFSVVYDFFPGRGTVKNRLLSCPWNDLLSGLTNNHLMLYVQIHFDQNGILAFKKAHVCLPHSMSNIFDLLYIKHIQ